MASNFPKLPGYVPTHDPTIVSHKKISHVKLEKNRNGNNVEVPLYAVPKPPAANFRPEKDEMSKSLSQTQYVNHLGGNMDEQFEPTFVKLDKQVLRFYGYFKESVVESRLENHRIHKVLVYYFLEDKSIMIIEPKIENSGVPQGAFLKRQMVLKGDGMSPFMPQDFRVGLDIGIHGRAIRITDADEYTRQFFENLGCPQPENQEIPMDAFNQSLIKVARPRDNDMKEYMEKTLRTGGGKVTSIKQFLDNDRKVLRFFCSSEDLPFIVHYYLADDTVEIREVHHPNDGRDAFPKLLQRQRLPYRSDVNQPGLHFIGDNYLTADEIYPDRPINAFGRDYAIHGVDQYTQEYFMAKHGRVFELGAVQMPEAPEATQRQIPPYNGFGNEEDTLGYIYDLIPKKPKGDFFKSVDNDKKILRYTARFNTRVPEDIDRRFIISFYLQDDSISIYEPAVKNSGIIEGPFLRRNKYKNVDKNNEWILPTDLGIGCDIKINGYSYHIISCDDYTVKYLQSHLD